MRYSLSYNTILRLRTSFGQSQPNIGIADVTQQFKLGIKQSISILQRNFLEKLKKSGSATKEIRGRARGNLGIHDKECFNKGVKNECNRLIDIRINLKKKESSLIRKKWLEKRTENEKRMNLFLKEQLRELEKEELNRVWEAEKKRLEDRLKDIKRTDVNVAIPEELEGIKVSDNKLEEQFGTHSVTPIILGGIQATENMKDFLRLPLNFRLYPKLERMNHEIQVEGRATRSRWNLRDKRIHPNEDFETFRQRKEKEEEDREPLQGNRVDFTNLRVTQFISNKQVYMPQAEPHREEVMIGAEKLDLNDAFDEFFDENCDEKGRVRGSQNLTPSQQQGRREILDGIKTKNWTLYGTDKSGKLVLDTVKNFNKVMEPHYVNEREVSISDVHKAEPGLNTLSKVWTGILQLGKNAGQGQTRRISNALHVDMSTVPACKGMRKDHKRCDNSDIGPPCRPVVDGKIGPNAPTGNLMTRLLKTVREGLHRKIQTEVLSTEELLHHIEQHNIKQQNRTVNAPRESFPRAGKIPPLQSDSYIIGSMDVIALYPNCKKIKTANKIEIAMTKCDLEFDNIDRELLVKVASILVKGNSGNRGLDEFLQVPKRTTTLTSYLRRRRETQFSGPPLRNQRELNKTQVNKLLGIVTAHTSKEIMDKHFFTINKKIYQQKDGCPIGLDFSVDAAAIYMMLWDDDLLKTLRKLGITMGVYKRYVDDITAILRAINKGWMFDRVRKKMVYDEERAESDTDPDDLRTLKVITEIANSLDDDIQLTFEVPSQQEDERLPVLDLGLKVVNNKVQHYFYKKPMSSPFAILYESAISAQTKRNSLLQEGLRRIRNTCQEAPVEEFRLVMSKYMNMLRISGYDEKYRVNLLKGILKRKDDIEIMIGNGTRVRYRSREQIVEQKQQKLGKFANTWFLRNNIINTLKITATPQSTLKYKIHDTLRKRVQFAEGGETKVIEMGGALVTSGMSKSENFGGSGSCFMGENCNVDRNTDCRVNRSVYLSQCQTCLNSQEPRNSSYVGTTGCLTHKRQRQHMAAMRTKTQTNAQSKHHWNDHPHQQPHFKTTILKGGMRFNVDRQICESLFIEQLGRDDNINLLNQRSEWGHHNIPRLQVIQPVAQPL